MIECTERGAERPGLFGLAEGALESDSCTKGRPTPETVPQVPTGGGRLRRGYLDGMGGGG